MQSIATLAHTAFNQPKPKPETEAGAESREAVKNLFLLLQGSYGSLFLSKFATGVLDEKKRDLGIRAAMAVWRAATATCSTACSSISAATPSSAARPPSPCARYFRA